MAHGRLKAGPASGGCSTALVQLLTLQRQAEIHILQGQTDCVALPAVDAGKRTDSRTAHEQLIHIHSRSRFINIRRRGIVRKGD